MNNNKDKIIELQNQIVLLIAKLEIQKSELDDWKQRALFAEADLRRKWLIQQESHLLLKLM